MLLEERCERMLECQRRVNDKATSCLFMGLGMGADL
jgi:hypothetical protein